MLLICERKWLLTETTLGDNSVKIIEMTTKDFKYYINLVDKAAAEFEMTDSKFERILLWYNAITQYHRLQRNYL